MACRPRPSVRTTFKVYLGLLCVVSILYVYLHYIDDESVNLLPNELLSLDNETVIRALFATYIERQESNNQNHTISNFALFESYHSFGAWYNDSFWNDDAFYKMKLERQKNKSLEFPLLTLFTSWPPHDKKFLERNNTLIDWAYLKPYVQCVFFYNNGTNVSNIQSYGWDALPVSRASSSGVPVLKYMFLDAMTEYRSVFYGYANGDILFDKGLIKTLRAIAMERWRYSKPFLIVGRRTNVNDTKKLDRKDIRELSIFAKKGKLFRYDAEDYFITDASYPWENIPGVVIGRPAYDNWLVLNACKHKYHVIDASKTVLAVHQTTQAGNQEGMTHSDAKYNTHLLRKMFKRRRIQYLAGNVLCAPWFTDFESNVTIKIMKRTKLHKVCFKQKT